ncbi:MAG: hypothetical protein ABIN96_10435 [Rubrivivax sp.]
MPSVQHPPTSGNPSDPRLIPDEFKPISPRRRLLIVVLALATAGTVMYSVLERPGLHLTRQVTIGPDGRSMPVARSDEPPRCSTAQQTDCVGGEARVIMVAPVSGAGSAAAGASTAR